MREEIIGGQRLILGDCLEVLPGLEAGSVDAVITDPPYGSYLCGEWDVPCDIPAAIAAIGAIAAEFVAWFGQFPDSADWYFESRLAGWHLCEHVAWIKRNATPSDRLNRCHESIFCWATGKRRQFYTTKGPYEDVKVPGVLVDAISLAGVQRYISTMHSLLNGNAGAGIIKPSTPNDMKRWGSGRKMVKLHPTDRAPREAGFTNVWSFFPPNCRPKKGQEHDWHPCAKPPELIARIVEMLTADGGSLCDPFMGSGTTLVAAELLGRRGIGIEIDPGYFDIACRRVEEAVRKREAQEAQLTLDAMASA